MGDRAPPSVLSSTVTDVALQTRRRMGPAILRFEHARLALQEKQQQQHVIKKDTCLDGIFKPAMEYSFEDDSPAVNVTLRSNHVNYSNQVPSVRRLQGSPFLRTFLALRDRDTNEIRLVEANTATLGAEVEPPEATNPLLLKKKSPITNQEDEIEAKKKESLAMKRHLVSQFGQARGQRMYEQAETNKVDLEAVGDRVAEAAMEVAEDKLRTEEERERRDRLIPPINRDARDVIDVYDPSDLLTRDEMDSMRGDVEAYLGEYDGSRETVQQSVDAKEISAFFGSLLNRLVTRPLSPSVLDSACLCVYAEALSLLVRARVRDLNRGAAMLMPNLLPASARTRMFETFTESRRLTPVSRDTAICHCLVAGLLASGDFQVEYQAFATTFRKKQEEVKRLVSVCGGRMISDSLTGQKYLTLRIPLVSFDPDVVRSGRNKLKSKKMKEAVAAAAAAEQNKEKKNA